MRKLSYDNIVPVALLLWVRLMLPILIVGSMASCALPKPENSRTSPSLSITAPRSSSPAKLILFVHGVIGDPTKTWTNESNVSWLEMMRTDPDLSNYAIGALGYDTTLVTRYSGIESVATGLLAKLETEKVFERYNEIYFVTHSMGGLVAKRMLVALNTPKQFEKLRHVKAILYISTPAQGNHIAELMSRAFGSSQLKDMRTANENSFLEGLENQWQTLFRERGAERFPLSFCAYETEETLGVLVVGRVDTCTMCDENSVPVTRNHISIVKPKTRGDDIYTWTRGRIKKTSAEISIASVPQECSANREVVKALYLSILTPDPTGDSEPDEPDLNQWINLLHEKQSIKPVIQSMVKHPKFNSYRVSSSINATSKSETPYVGYTWMANSLYWALLGRLSQGDLESVGNRAPIPKEAARLVRKMPATCDPNNKEDRCFKVFVDEALDIIEGPDFKKEYANGKVPVFGIRVVGEGRREIVTKVQYCPRQSDCKEKTDWCE